MTPPEGGRGTGEPTRRLIDKALAAPLSPGALRVLLATVHLLTTWAKTRDTASREQVAKLARLSERQTTRALAELESHGLIVWTPGRKHVLSTLSFAHLSETPECLTNDAFSETPECPTEPDLSETSERGQRDISTSSAGHAACPASEGAEGTQGEGDEPRSTIDLANALLPISLSIDVRPLRADEIRHYLDACVDQYGDDAVSEEVLSLVDEGRRFAYLSHLRIPLRQRLERRPAQLLPDRTKPPPCSACGEPSKADHLGRPLCNPCRDKELFADDPAA